MSRALLVLANDQVRAKAALWCAKLPTGTRVEFKETKRTVPQNDRFWAMLTDVSAQVQHAGCKLPPEDWKLLFMHQLRGELRLLPNLDGDGFVPIGNSSSDLGKGEMSALIELIFAYGAKHGVRFLEDRQAPSAAA